MFQIQKTYLDAVNRWQVAENAQAPDRAVEYLAGKVTESVRSLMQLKPTFEGMAKSTLSNQVVLYAVAQDKDRKAGRSTPDRLQNVTPEERAVLCKVITNLTPLYPENAKEAVLLYGAWHVQEALKFVPKDLSIEELIEEMERTITRLQNTLSTLPTSHAQYSALEQELATARTSLNALIDQL